jgi:hypothetical protein
MQLANEFHVQKQQNAIQQGQLQLNQQAQPSEIAQREALTGQAQAEAAAIPKRLDLQQKEIDATNELKKSTLALETSYRNGMLGVAQSNSDTKARAVAAQAEYKNFQELWGAKLDQAKIGGILGTMQLRRQALSQQKQISDMEIGLRAQANDLRSRGLDEQADMLTERADQYSNQIGVLRSVAGKLGLAPEVQIPGEAGQPPISSPPRKSAAPNKPTSKGLVTVTDPSGRPHVFANQAAADAFKKEAGIQ